MKNFLLDLFFPRRCIGCGESDTWLCNDCFSFIEPKRNQCCYICRKPNHDGRTCLHHQRTMNRLDGLLIAAHYDANPMVKKAIWQLKFYRRQSIAEKLGQLLIKPFSFLDTGHWNLVIVPVPLHPHRLRKRGFNQAELLANHVYESRRDARSCVSTLLTRIRDTLSQVECRDRQTRLKNPQGAFSLNGHIDPKVTYVLVDDLVTTGATLEECCRVLKENGAKTVWGLVLARN